MNAGIPRGKALPELHVSERGTETAGECATVVLAQISLWSSPRCQLGFQY